MADLTRPPAPFLPPEIISKILHFVHPKRQFFWGGPRDNPEFERISRVASGWTVESQRRLFEEIQVKDSFKLFKLFKSLGSAPGLGRYILALGFDCIRPPNAGIDAHLFFQLLSSVPNLIYLSFTWPPFESFSQEDSARLRLAPPLLPKLASLHMRADCPQFLRREVADAIIATAPNLETLVFENSRDYVGRMWDSIIPMKLRKLSLGAITSVLEGKLWPASQFQGLESLSINFACGGDSFTLPTQETRNNFIPFFEAVGPTLLELEYDLPIELYYLFPVLEKLTLTTLAALPIDRSSAKLLLPASLISLSIEDPIHSSSEREEEVPYFPTIPLEAWSHLINLEYIKLMDLHESYDLSQLAVKKLTIESCLAEVLLDSMEDLEIDSTLIGELELLEIHARDDHLASIENFDGKDIRIRCEELGIKLSLSTCSWR